MELNRRISELLKKTIGQRYDAMALKMISDESELPQNTVYPVRDMGQHMSLCQAFALSRREGKTVYMQKQDHWCWAPLIGYGMVKLEKGTPEFNELLPVIGIRDPDAAAAFIENMPHLPTGVYKGILTAPLGSAEFKPDALIINCRNSELRTILMGIKTQTGTTMKTEFDAIDSCVWGIIPSLTKNEYRVSFPDPGDYSNANTSEDDVILSVPNSKFEELAKGLETLNYMGMKHSFFHTNMEYDFARPTFYNKMFKAWGLDEGKSYSIPGL
ncbi:MULTISPECIES: DUF169 domain-containing protein [Ruminococcus]|uniref:Uncharacterized conserved protein, DUF169 family n=1 Tax=Ruminococcus flavefaciens TaxID=1265 RepID=A0A1M7JMA3_RUMFL|nr:MULTISPECIES: DUF169 domain-containing protein [Ruminococcus]MCR4795781.1 DUF169 domain-containing protein [Ruminococcus sp.]SHM54041.1 Uncharacterized conserved protein, DUF169 family [Ruminococcus flavefaciens]